MADAFIGFKSRNTGTSPTIVGGYTVGAGKTATVIGMSISNVTLSAIKASVSIYDGTNDYFLVKNADLVPGEAIAIIGGDQKVVMNPGDSIRVVSNAAASVDSILSVLELS